MKKNITINLCGRLFAIDEDAYQMLSTYEQSLRNYFRTREGGEEIAADIEARIAELLDELKAQGVEAVNIQHVTDIIHRIGKPEEMEGNDQPTPDPSPGEENSSRQQTIGNESPSLEERIEVGRSPKRLYRNPNDKKVMGVLSGFAAYFGGDPLWWRLGYMGLLMLIWVMPWVMPLSIIRFLFVGHSFVYEDGAFFNSLLLVFCYIVLAVLMPVAETPEDRLRMKGKEVNPQNLAEEITSPSLTPNPSPRGEGSGYHTCEKASNSQIHSASSLEGRAGGEFSSGCLSTTFGCIGGFFSALWAVVTFVFRWCIYAFGAFLAVMCLVGIFCLFAVAFSPIESVFSNSFMASPEFAELLPTLKVPFLVFLVSAVLVLSITAYAIIHSLLNEFRQMPSMPYRQRITLLLMWIAGIIVAGSALGSRWVAFIEAENQYSRRVWSEHDAEYRAANTHDGIFVTPREWEFLQKNGWHILNAEGCNDRFTANGEYMTGDRDVRYLDCWDDHHRQRYRVERTETLQPGTYRLTCAARANGTGACVYVIVGEGEPQFKEIPSTGNTGGNIYLHAKREMARIWQEAESLGREAEYPEDIRALVEARGHEGGYGWNLITFEPIRITKATVLRYGLTSDDAFTHHTWLGQYFSATDFVVEQL